MGYLHLGIILLIIPFIKILTLGDVWNKLEVLVSILVLKPVCFFGGA